MTTVLIGFSMLMGEHSYEWSEMMAMSVLGAFPLCFCSFSSNILKAATFTPQTAFRIAELYKEAGLPDGVLNLVPCSRNEVDTLLNSPDIAGISFVGSLGVEQIVYSKTAAGIINKLAAKMVALSKEIKGGHTYDKTTKLCPVINAAHMKSVSAPRFFIM